MSSNPTEETIESTPNRSIVRSKSDPAWAHCRFSDDSSKKHLVCMYCNKVFKGGGISRFKQHLAGIKGDVEPCKKVSDDIRFQMRSNVNEFNQRKRKAQEEIEENNPYCEEHVEHTRTSEEVQELGSSKGKGKEKVTSSLSPYFMPRTTPGAQPTLKSVLQSQEARERCDLAISKWIIDASVPFNAVNSAYYQHMIDAIASMGAGYKGPSAYNLRVNLLKKNVEEVKLYVNSFRSIWKETGCTIMADGWTD